MTWSINHLSTSGVRRARRLPAVMHRKLATCQCRSGRICFESQRSSLGSQDDQRLRLCERKDNNSTLKREYAGAVRLVQKMNEVLAFRSIRRISPTISRILKLSDDSIRPATRQLTRAVLRS